MQELEAAQAGRLPNLITEADLKGDLHLHSEWSDGRDPIERMIEAAVEQGYQYMALTDHSSGRGIANGLSNERLLEQIGLLRSLQDHYPITILCAPKWTFGPMAPWITPMSCWPSSTWWWHRCIRQWARTATP